MPSAVEGTEEERSEEESQGLPSVLVATAIVSQKGKGGASDTILAASLATTRISRPKSFSTQSIDDGYVPEGTFDEEDRGRKQTRSHEVEAGYLPDGHTTPGDQTEEDQEPDDPNKLKLSGSVPSSDNIMDADVPTVMPPPPVEPAASQSIDDGYIPSAVEEERSEEEDTLTDAKVPSGTLHDTEEESLALASSTEVTEKHSKPDVCTTGAVKSQEAMTVEPKHPSADYNDSANIDVEPSSKRNEPKISAHLLQPITENPLMLANTPKNDDGSPKFVRSSRRKANNLEAEKPIQHSKSNVEDEEAASVQSESSSVRRSSRIKAKVSSSPKVPSSITTGVREKKNPSLPVVPEGEKLEEPEMAATVIARTRQTRKRGVNDDDNASRASSASASVSIASRTRRRGKRGANDHDNDDASHVSSVNDESSKATSENKRVKTIEGSKQATNKAAGGKRKIQSDHTNINDDVSESVSSQPATASKGRAKKGKTTEAKDDASKHVTSPPKTQGGRRKKKDNEQEPITEQFSPVTEPTRRTRTRTKEEPSKSLDSPPKTRGSRKKEDEIESIPSTPPATRSSRRTRKTTQSEASESVASTRPRRNARSTKKYDM